MEELSDNIRIPSPNREDVHQDTMEIPATMVAKTSSCTSQEMDFSFGKQGICSLD
jgi:hypothetical protein